MSVCVRYAFFLSLFAYILQFMCEPREKSDILHILLTFFFFSKHLYTKQQQYLNHQCSFGQVLHVYLEHLRSTKWDFWSYPVVSNMSTLNLF